MNFELIFIFSILSLAIGAYVLYSYLNAKQSNPIREHIKNVAGSWVWMLSLLFGAYWFGEMTMAVLILAIGIKGLHEIARLHMDSTSHLYTSPKTPIKDESFSFNKRDTNNRKETKEAFISSAPKLLLTLILVTILLLMTISWLELNHLLSSHNERSMMLFLLFVVQFNDVNQYIAGRLFGNKLFAQKLAPTISPNKTIEGAIFGTLMTGMFSLPIGYYLTYVSLWACLGISVLMGACGIAGDLLQSAVKRQYGVKDMDNWIKGHGGIMDRVDSLLIALPIFVLIFTW